jgi:transcriptional regulator of acetoin/glycerol metabolism
VRYHDQSTSSDQRNASGALEQAAKEPCQGAGSPSSRPIILTIQGEPGTGKSTLLRVLVEEVRKLEKALVVTATSATAAHRLGLSYTDTVDAACQIPRSGPITSLRPDNAGTLALRLLDLLVCDELSMLSKDKLGNILHTQAPPGHSGGQATQGAAAGGRLLAAVAGVPAQD